MLMKIATIWAHLMGAVFPASKVPPPVAAAEPYATQFPKHMEPAEAEGNAGCAVIPPNAPETVTPLPPAVKELVHLENSDLQLEKADEQTTSFGYVLGK
ncbi:MAG: hypothetical protein Q9223_007423 [Gallowayella weberi]